MDVMLLVGMGAVAGILAGLLGVGGGIVIVPVLALVFSGRGVSNSVLMHVAIGTSLATIVVTSLASIRAHHRRGAVEWQVFRRITPGIVVGGMVGAAIADKLSGSMLRLMFGGFMLFFAAQLAFGSAPPPHRQLPESGGILAVGTFIGTVASLLGIGGGSMSVPFLTWCNVPVRRAVATSAAIGLPIAVSGALSYIVTGWSTPERPPLSIGYLNLPAFVGIVVASTLSAPLGAALAHRISPLLLRRGFALFLLIIAIRMLLT